MIKEKILNSFKKKMGKEVEGLDLFVYIPDTWDEEHACQVMETKDNGKVWEVECTRSGNVKDIWEL